MKRVYDERYEPPFQKQTKPYRRAKAATPDSELSCITAIYVVKGGSLEVRFGGDGDFVTIELFKGDLLPFAINAVGEGDAQILALS